MQCIYEGVTMNRIMNLQYGHKRRVDGLFNQLEMLFTAYEDFPDESFEEAQVFRLDMTGS